MARNDPPRIRATAGVTEEVVLIWDDGPYAGLRVVCQPEASIGLSVAFEYPASSNVEQAARFGRFGQEILRDWNLDDDKGIPIPATGEGMTAIPQDLAWQIVRKFSEATIGVTGPLDRPSSQPHTADGSQEKSGRPSSTSNSANGSAARRTRSQSGR